ncbi:probable protein SEY1 [Zygosaccharomyces bailii ISA1307]|nr:probable protein SEY1 [Zygosaccharomyces bailii ISA1307]
MEAIEEVLDAQQTAIQLIDERKQFHQNALAYFNKCIGDRDVGLSYHVISVFGSQSSGKSTLLNYLFNTTFDTMDAQVKRQQTTKGIWLAHTRNVNTTNESQNQTADLFVLDVEGSDGAERGEDQDFERKAALFAISVSEVLIVNMWEQQIGLYQGNNMALLKTVFEVNLSLFGKNPNGHKVLLLFVIRDHVGITPLSSLRDSLVTELEKVWSELNKPIECENSSLYDFFDLEFVGLAHKLLQADEFHAGVKKLGDSFTRKDVEPHYFKPQYHHNLPLDGWIMYSENCWEQVENNRDLDLPTQQILVARFKTDEVAQEALVVFNSQYSDAVDEFFDDREKLGESLKTLKEECLTYYDERAYRYAEAVYLEKRSELIAKMEIEFAKTVRQFLDTLSDALLKKLEVDAMDKKTSRLPFVEKVQNAKNSIKDEFLLAVSYFQQLGLLKTVGESIQSFDEIVEAKTEELRKEEIGTTTSVVTKAITMKVKEQTIHYLSNPEKDTWDKILEMFEKVIQLSLSRYEVSRGIYDFQVGFSEDENEMVYKKIRSKAWHVLNVTVHDYLKPDTIVSILRDKFETKFRYDDNDSPRLWKNEEEIDRAFSLAKEQALDVLNVLSFAATSDHVEVVPEFFDNDNQEDDVYEDELGIEHSRHFAHILNELRKEKVLQAFKRQINLTVLDSKRSIIKTTTSIPLWIYALIVVLGWNEFMMVLRNPLFVTLALIVAVSLFFIHRFGLWSPVMNMAHNAVDEVRITAKEKLRALVLEDNEKSQALNAMSKESFNMKDLSEVEDEKRENGE